MATRLETDKSSFLTAPRSMRWSLAGLAVGIVGLVIQWIADPAKFDGFPPGIGFIAGFGLLAVVAARWWWAPIFAVLISLWIVFGGWAAGKLIPNFRSHDMGTVAGNAVMTAGLLFAVVTGVAAMAAARRSLGQPH